MGIMSSIASALGSGAAKTVTDTASGLADVVERWVPADKDRVQMVTELDKVVQAARAYDPRSTATGKVAELINVIVDGVTRFIRPTVTIILLGGVFGWWNLAVTNVDPIVVSWGTDVMAFWFGTRMIFKDLPSFLKTLKELRK